MTDIIGQCAVLSEAARLRALAARLRTEAPDGNAEIGAHEAMNSAADELDRIATNVRRLERAWDEVVAEAFETAQLLDAGVRDGIVVKMQ